MFCARQDRLDLRPAAVRDDQLDAEAVQQVQVVDDAEERVVGHDFAAERDDERPAAECVDVRGRRADPVHERRASSPSSPEAFRRARARSSDREASAAPIIIANVPKFRVGTFVPPTKLRHVCNYNRRR